MILGRLATGFFALLWIATLSAMAAEIDPADDGPAAVSAAVKAVETARPEKRRRASARLIALGPGALEETRKARDRATDPGVKKALAHAARWLLASSLKPVLLERSATNLTFDGQYSDLKSKGPETAEAMFVLFDDEESPEQLRMAAAHALADLASPKLLPRMQQMEVDPLLSARIREEVRTVMAILGDTRGLDQRIEKFTRGARQKRQELENLTRRLKAGDLDRRRSFGAQLELSRLKGVLIDINVELSNLHYRIRHYGEAVSRYGRAVKLLEELHSESADKSILEARLSLTYYNFACSLSLNEEIDRSREMIQKAVRFDSGFLKTIDQDGDLRKMREAPGYKKFKREMEKELEKESI